MKTLLATLAAAVLLAPAAFAAEYALPSATSVNAAAVGAQLNQQYGYFNEAGNSASIRQAGAARADSWPLVYPYGFAPGGAASTTNRAEVGAQVNIQEGAFNRAYNNVEIDQRGRASGGFFGGSADVSNTATVGAQINMQSGIGNSAGNSTTITQTGDARTDEGFLLLPR